MIQTVATAPRSAPSLEATIRVPTVQPCGERQGRLSVSYLNSATLGRRTSLSVYLPPCYVSEPSRVYPVLYLLHGVNADHTQWPDLNVSPEADALTANRAITPLDIVMPNGNRRAAEDYAAFILCDVIPDVKQALLVSRQRTYRAIGGLSRGGYWALYLALLHPDISSAVGGHSPATNAALTEALALNAGGGEQSTLRIYLNVGRNDPLAPDVASLAATAEARHLNVVFHLNDGDHDRA